MKGKSDLLQQKSVGLKGHVPSRLVARREVKQLCGNDRSARKDIRSILRTQTDCTDQELADKINEAFVSVMQEYNPLSDDALVLCEARRVGGVEGVLPYSLGGGLPLGSRKSCPLLDQILQIL